MLKYICHALLLTIILTSCGNDRLKVDLSTVKTESLSINRLDRDIFALKPANIEQQNAILNKKYGNYYTSFLNNVINKGDVRDSIYKALSLFVQDKDLNEAYNDVQKIYTDELINQMNTELNKSFSYFKYHFPNAETPKQYVAYISGWNYNFTSVDSTLGIGLDMYLGGDNKFYQMLQYPKYKTAVMTKDYLISDAMKFWLIHTFDENEPVNNLLCNMIYYGKLYYCLDAVMPDTPDSIKISYNNQQLNYCKKYEKNIWVYFTEKDRLYKTDLKEISEYISEGPFTSAISKECPPRIAMWVGWQIVRTYMNKHKDITLEQLMADKDAQKILIASRYKP